MNPRTKLALLALVGTCISTRVAIGQPVAEKPDWKVGDHWEYQQTTTVGNQAPTSNALSRKIEAFLPDDRIEVRSGSGKLEQFDSAMNFMPDGRADATRIYARYPLKVGAEWTYSMKAGAMDGTENGSVKTVAYESITVPAGTFACYRTDGESNFNNKNYRERRVWSRWYCPEVKWIAKQRLETTTFKINTIGGTTVETWELLKFTSGR
jgi:hypothetical protein